MGWAPQIQILLDTGDIATHTSDARTHITHYQRAEGLARDASASVVAVAGRILLPYAALHQLADALAHRLGRPQRG